MKTCQPEVIDPSSNSWNVFLCERRNQLELCAHVGCESAFFARDKSAIQGRRETSVLLWFLVNMLCVYC